MVTESGGATSSETEAMRPTSLSQKLGLLFRTVRSREQDEYSFEEVAETIRAGGGPTISATYIWQLRKGLRDNPTKKHLEALAGFFGVSPAYFFDDEAAERIRAELDLLAALRDSSVRQIALRANGLSASSLNTIASIVERVRELENVQERQSEDSRGTPPGSQ